MLWFAMNGEHDGIRQMKVLFEDCCYHKMTSFCVQTLLELASSSAIADRATKTGITGKTQPTLLKN